MFSSAEKTNHHATAVQQKAAGTTFFRKAGEDSFFGSQRKSSFFSNPVQAKLTVSTPDDPQEKEADEVADKVMRMTEPAATSLPQNKEEEKLQKQEDKREDAQAKAETPAINIIQREEKKEEEVHAKNETPAINIIQRSEEQKEEVQAKAEAPAINIIQREEKKEEEAHAKNETPAINIIQRAEEQKEEMQAKAEAPAINIIQREEKKEEEVHAKNETPAINIVQRAEEQKEEVQAKGEAPAINIIQREEKKEEQNIHAKCEACEKEEKKVQTKVFAKPETGFSENINRKKISLFHSDVVQRSGRGPPAESIPFEQSLASSKGGGSVLPGNTQQFMESRFNADFSGVRIHTGSHAENLSRSINAQAFAHGNDIYFNSGKYTPGTTGGDTLLAHELTHTIQQGATRQLYNPVPAVAPKFNHLPPKTILNPGTAYNSQFVISTKSDKLFYTKPLIGNSNASMNGQLHTKSAVEQVIQKKEDGIEKKDAGEEDDKSSFVPHADRIIEPQHSSSLLYSNNNFHSGVTQSVIGDSPLSVSLPVHHSFVQHTLSRANERGPPPGLEPAYIQRSSIWDRVTSSLGSAASYVSHGVRAGAQAIGRGIVAVGQVLRNRLSQMLRGMRGFPLITVLIGRDPVANQDVPRTLPNIIRGFMSLMQDGETQYRQLEQSGAIAQIGQRVDTAVNTLNITRESVDGLLDRVWESINWESLTDIGGTFDNIARIIAPTILRIINFLDEIIRIVIDVVLMVMRIPRELVASIISRVREAWHLIKEHPIDFLKNLLRALKQGFLQFYKNKERHLRAGLQTWLMAQLGQSRMPLPQDFSARGIFSWVLAVLNITMETIWQKLGEHPRIGRERVDRLRRMINRLTGIWQFIRDVQQRGMVAIWERMAEQLTNLQTRVIDGIVNWIMSQVINRGMTWLLSMLDPTGIMTIIRGAQFLFETIYAIVQYLRELLEMINTFLGGVIQIANGNISVAAGYLERSLAQAIPVAIGFLANLLHLGNLGQEIANVLVTVRGLVDRALTWLVNRAVDTGFAIIDRLMAMGRSARDITLGRDERTDDEKQRDLNLALDTGAQAVNRYAGRTVGATILRPLLTLIRIRYRITRLEPVLDGENWTVEGEINPRGTRRTTARGTPLAINYNPSPLDNYGRATQVTGEPLIFSPTLITSDRNMTLPAPGKFLIPSEYRYNDGHLLPHSFGGPDNDAKNLAAISVGTNMQFSAVEGRVRRTLQTNQTATLQYRVNCEYANNGPTELENWMKTSYSTIETQHLYDEIGALIFNMIKDRRWSSDTLAQRLNVDRVQFLEIERALKLKSAFFYLPRNFIISIGTLTGGASVSGGNFSNHLPNPRNPSRPLVPRSFMRAMALSTP